MVRNVESLAQLNNIQEHLSPQIELIVLFFFDPLDEKSNRMVFNLDFWSERDKYGDHVLFLKCDTENSNRDIFEKYNVRAIPTFLFIKNNEQVARPATGSDIRRGEIEAVLNGLLNNN